MRLKEVVIALISVFFINNFAFSKDFKKVEPSYKSMCEQNLHVAKVMRKGPLINKFSNNKSYASQLSLVDQNIQQAQSSLTKDEFEACYYCSVSAILLMKSLSNMQKANKHENPTVGR